MDVVGGTYLETVTFPAYRELIGSGLRAAALLRSVDAEVVLHSAVEESAEPIARATASGLGLTAQWQRRTEAVAFEYFTPLSAPLVTGGSAVLDGEIRIEAESALVFGMLEGDPPVRARRIVFDPQRPGMETLDVPAHLEAEATAIVANRGELLRLGGSRDPLIAARALLARGVSVVVVKLAAFGALVVTPSEVVLVRAIPTGSVWPIGSGDAFAAGFAWAWARQGEDAVTAAKVGSSVAAHWCETRQLHCAPDTFSPRAGIQSDQAPEPRPVVYLAAPFFDVGQRWLVELLRDSLSAAAPLRVFSPLHDVGAGGREVAESDLEGLAASAVVLAVLDGGDLGTTFEVGWARAVKTPVVAYATRVDPEAMKLIDGSGCVLLDDLSTAVYRTAWTALGYS